jgi:DNA-binding winged helix-turn-helix (wHTH) protein
MRDRHREQLGKENDHAEDSTLGTLELAVVVVNATCRVLATNVAGRRLLHAGLDAVLADGRFRRLLATLDGGDTPIEQDLAVPMLTPTEPPMRLRLRLRPLQDGAVLELARTPTGGQQPAPVLAIGLASGQPAPSSSANPGAVGLAERIYQESAQLTRLVGDFVALMAPPANPERVNGILVPTGGVLHGHGITLDIDAHTVTVRGKPVELPLRQFDLLRILIANAGRVISREQLIELLWPQPLADGSNTIDVHIRRLRRALDPSHSGPSCIRSVRKVGYMFAADAPTPTPGGQFGNPRSRG